MTVSNVLLGSGSNVQPVGGTWNPAAAQGDLTFSGGNLIVSQNASTNGSVRGTVGKSTGRWSYKVTVNDISVGSSGRYIGVANSSQDVDQPIWNSANGVGFNQAGSIAGNNTVLASGLATYTNGDVIEVIFDADARTIEFKKNTVSVGSPVSISFLTGTIYPSVTLRENGDQMTGNFTT